MEGLVKEPLDYLCSMSNLQIFEVVSASSQGLSMSPDIRPRNSPWKLVVMPSFRRNWLASLDGAPTTTNWQGIYRGL